MASSKEQIINSEQALEAYIALLRSEFNKHHYLRATLKNGKQRTLTQNNSLHKYCDLLAEELTAAGLDMKATLKPEVDIPWTGANVKEHLWRPIQKIVTGKESTTKPETHEYSHIYDVLSRYLAETKGVYVPWPCKDDR